MGWQRLKAWALDTFSVLNIQRISETVVIGGQQAKESIPTVVPIIEELCGSMTITGFLNEPEGRPQHWSLVRSLNDHSEGILSSQSPIPSLILLCVGMKVSHRESQAKYSMKKSCFFSTHTAWDGNLESGTWRPLEQGIKMSRAHFARQVTRTKFSFYYSILDTLVFESAYIASSFEIQSVNVKNVWYDLECMLKK